MEIENLEHSKPKINCMICKAIEHKYKCPRCQVKTCCIACCNKHKEIYKCSGKKDPFASKTLENFTEKEMRQDIRFLSNALNGANNSLKSLFSLTFNEEKKIIEKRQKNFKKLCQKYRNVDLRRAPIHMKQNKENKSYCDPKEKKFFWTIKFDFISQGERQTHTFENPIDDSQYSLEDLLKLLYEDLSVSLKLRINLERFSNFDDFSNNSQILYRVIVLLF